MTDWVGLFIHKFKMLAHPSNPDAYKIIDDQIKIFIPEEVNELLAAWQEGDAEEVIDALGDIAWHCDKTLKQLLIDPQLVRDEIGRANLAKVSGIKSGREDAKVDVVKPQGWKPPNHSANHGCLDEIIRRYNGEL